MGLLLADLRVLGNLATTPDGRRIAAHTGIGFALLGLMSYWLADTLAENPELLRSLRQNADGDPLRSVFGYGLLACPMIATWLGLSLAQRQLFECVELPLWRVAPTSSLRAPLQVLLRATFLSVCWSAALAGPFLLVFLVRSPAPAWAVALVPLALLGCTAPLLATLLAVQIVLMRFFAGRILRLVIAWIAGLASIAFLVWLLLNLFLPGPARARDLATSVRRLDELPWTIDAAAGLLANAARGTLDLPLLGKVLGWLALGLTIFTGAALLHARACERHLEADAPLLSRFRRRWPARIGAAVRRKELAQVMQQPGALLGFLSLAVLVWALSSQRVLVSGIFANWRLPVEVMHVGAMLMQWFLAVLLVLYAHMGRVAMWDGAQWSLYMLAPTQPGAILRGKLSAIALFLAWPIVLVAAAGAHLFGADRATILTFLGVALGGTGVAIGVLATIGTWPRLMRPDEGGQILQGGRSFFAAILLVSAFEAAVLPALLGWLALSDFAQRHGLSSATAREGAPWLVAAALSYGGLVLALGLWFGTRNYRRLLSPRA